MKKIITILSLSIPIFLFTQLKKDKFIPSSPQSSFLASIGNLTVNKAVGKINYSIPIYEIKIGDYIFPIELTYNYSGYQPSEQKGMLGRGWNINNSGIISVNVRGIDDFSHFGYSGYNRIGKTIVKPFLNGDIQDDVNLRKLANDEYDTEPDKYIFNVGNFHSVFMISPENEIIILSGERVKVNFNNSTSPDFKIFDNSGNQYLFEKNEITLSEEDHVSSKSAYNLTKIITNKNEIISFEFNNNVRVLKNINTSLTEANSGVPPNSPCYRTLGIQNAESIFSISENLVSRITFKEGKVDFEYGQDSLLKNIKIYNKASKITEYNLVYDSTNNFLITVEKVNNGVEYKFSFEYYNIQNFNEKSPFAVDHFGFYNISNSTDLMSGDKKIDFNSTLIGALKKIIFPTKGYSEFFYESNDYSGKDYFPTTDCQNTDFKNIGGVTALDNNIKKDSIYIPYEQIVKIIVTANASKLKNYGIVNANSSVTLPDGAISLTCSESQNLKANAYNELSNEEPDGNTDNVSQMFISYWEIPKGYIKMEAISENTANPNNISSNSNGSATVQIEYNKEIANVTKTVGGLRVTNIKTCNSSNKCDEKLYSYKNDDGTSSAILSFIPYYTYTTSCYSSYPSPEQVYHKIAVSNNIMPLNSYAGVPVTYNRIKETVKNKTGFIEETFSNLSTGAYDFYPIIPKDLNDKYIGLSKSYLSYSTDTLQYKSNQYFDIQNYIGKDNRVDGFNIYRRNVTYFKYFDDIAEKPTKLSDYVYKSYTYSNNDYKLNVSIMKEKFNNIIITTKNEYNYNERLQINSQTIIHPDKSIQKTTYQYAHEKGNQKLINANMIGIPLETTTVKRQNANDVNGKMISKTETRYDDPATLFPTSVLSYNLQNPDTSSTEVTYDKYDSKGNLQQYTTKNGISTTIIWGYNNTQPIAKIENAKLADINPAFISAIVSASDTDAAAAANNDETSLLNAFKTFRDNLPGYKITTYSYDPLIGVRSITPPSGIKQIYLYDSANRLKEIRENSQSGNLLKEFKYNYKQ
nr:hypothetical protein [uncultured Chryseobacterium sp.]